MGANGAHRAQPERARAGFGAVLRVRLFAVLYAAETQSIVGDQLGRVALSFLVFQQTGSAPATAATYAATLLPGMIGGFALSGLADRLPRRLVMVASDLLRAACFGVIAIPAVPLPAVIVLVVLAGFVGPVFSAAEVSLLSVRLAKDQFRAANGLRMISNQASQVAGFAFGGLVVAVLDPRPALLVDAATFAVSAVLISGVDRGHREAADATSSPPALSAVHRSASDEVFRVRRDRRLRALVTLTLLVGFFVVPEGLAVPFGASTGASTAQVGLLLAAGALGGACGAAFIVNVVPEVHRGRTANIMAVASGIPLVLSGVYASWPVAAVCWFLSGAGCAYVVEAMTEIVSSIPDWTRARVVGFAGALLLGAQGLGLVVFGAVADALSPSWSIALAGGIGSALAALLVVGPLRPRAPAAQAATAG